MNPSVDEPEDYSLLGICRGRMYARTWGRAEDGCEDSFDGVGDDGPTMKRALRMWDMLKMR